jgi:hypothetical protein
MLRKEFAEPSSPAPASAPSAGAIWYDGVVILASACASPGQRRYCQRAASAAEPQACTSDG